jgi:L-histidine Nalpha-methyltransferase
MGRDEVVRELDPDWTEGTESPERIREEVSQALRQDPPRIPSRFFYDERGARLFEEITALEEYYLTDAEVEILRTRTQEVADTVGVGARIVEYGSGSGEKTWILLDGLHRPAAYIPIDVARAQLVEHSAQVRERFPKLQVIPIAGDYTRLTQLPRAAGSSGAALAFFPGSTVGNLEPGAAVSFLATVAQQTGVGAYLLIGVDLAKDPTVLERAYNDAKGVTAQFNLNILSHLNRRIGSNFQVDGFRHRAIWNEERSRIEMHLVSLKHQTIQLGPVGTGVEPLVLTPDESVVTEHSYKYEVADFQDLAREAGYIPVSHWTDSRDFFSVHLLEVDSSNLNGRDGG